MPKIDLYGMDVSAPVRIVMITCDLTGVEYNFKVTDLTKGDNKTPEYLAINPQHNIPCIVDGDYKLNESKAIAAYIVNQYAKDDKLYPKDPKTRGTVDQRMYFDMGTLYKAFGDCVYPCAFGGATKIEEDKLDRLREVLGWVNDFLAPTGYVAGTEHLTLADVCFVATLSTLIETGGLVPDLDAKYPNIPKFMEKMNKEITNIEKNNNAGAKMFAGWVGPKLPK